jgi:hypothetical protein
MILIVRRQKKRTKGFLLVSMLRPPGNKGESMTPVRLRHTKKKVSNALTVKNAKGKKDWGNGGQQDARKKSITAIAYSALYAIRLPQI